jgi:hypothetical protein
MRKILASIMVFALIAVAGAVYAQQQQNSAELSSPDGDKRDTHDRSSGHVVLRVPAPANPGPNPPDPLPPPEPTNPVPPAEGEDIPPSETPPDGPPPEDPPTYYGEPVQGKFVFILDASGSMGWGSPPRVQTMRAETTSVIQALTEDDELDAVSYDTTFGPQVHYSKYMWGTLLPATEGNKSSAVAWINGPATNPGGGTPSYAALQRACQVYPADLTKMFFVSDGYPNVSGSAAQILQDFPSWWSKFEETEFISICIGGGGASFMQQLAALAGGTYIAA